MSEEIRSTAIEPGCLVLDQDDNTYRVLRILDPEILKTEMGNIKIQDVEVTDGIEIKKLPLWSLSRAAMMTWEEVLNRGYR